MRYTLLQKALKNELFFTPEKVGNILDITPNSARVLCSRYVQQDLFIRLKKNWYVLEQNWRHFSQAEVLKVANFLQVPSYISFISALSIYEVTTQVPRNFFESAAVKRSVHFNIKGVIFNFYKLEQDYYFDFSNQNDIFLATKEKAFLDCLYLYSLGKYRLDFSALDLNKLDRTRLKKVARVFPAKTVRLVQRLCGI